MVSVQQGTCWFAAAQQEFARWPPPEMGAREEGSAPPLLTTRVVGNRSPANLAPDVVDHLPMLVLGAEHHNVGVCLCSHAVAGRPVEQIAAA